LVSSGIIGGERRFAPGTASIALRRAAEVTTIGWAGSKSLSPVARKPREGILGASDLTTRQGIFENSADFTSHCQNHGGPKRLRLSLRLLPTTTRAASREGFARRCKALLDPLLALNTSGIHDADGQSPSAAIGPTRDRTSAESRPERRREQAVSARLSFGVADAHPSEKRGLFRFLDWD
jgi:hypothetical protein